MDDEFLVALTNMVRSFGSEDVPTVIESVNTAAAICHSIFWSVAEKMMTERDATILDPFLTRLGSQMRLPIRTILDTTNDAHVCAYFKAKLAGIEAMACLSPLNIEVPTLKLTINGYSIMNPPIIIVPILRSIARADTISLGEHLKDAVEIVETICNSLIFYFEQSTCKQFIYERIPWFGSAARLALHDLFIRTEVDLLKRWCAVRLYDEFEDTGARNWLLDCLSLEDGTILDVDARGASYAARLFGHRLEKLSVARMLQRLQWYRNQSVNLHEALGEYNVESEAFYAMLVALRQMQELMPDELLAYFTSVGTSPTERLALNSYRS